MASFAMAFVIWRRAAMVGTAALGMACTSPTWKERSGMMRLIDSGGALIQIRKETTNGLPHFAASGKAAPLCPDEADEPVTGVDWDDEVCRRLSDAVGQQRFDFRLHACEGALTGEERVPRRQTDQRLHRP